MNYTKGKWLADGSTVYCLNERRVNRFYAGVYAGELNDGSRTTEAELEANALLLAAAPALYEALKLAEAFIRTSALQCSPSYNEVMAAAYAALAQAEGKEAAK